MEVDKKSKEMDELEHAAQPLLEYLKKNHHLHTAVLVTNDRVMVLETTHCVPIR